MSFDLSTNPFCILDVSARASREDISVAFDEALADGRDEETLLHRAQQLVLAPKTRIDAELSWLLTIAPNASRRILGKITNPGEIDVIGDLSALRGIDLANLAADLCVRVSGQCAYVEALIEAYQDISVAEIQQIISSMRQAAGFPPPTNEMVEQALLKLRKLHAKAAIECIIASESPAKEMTDIVSTFLSDGTAPIANVMSDIVREYDAWSEPHLAAVREKIDEAIKACRTRPKEVSIGGIKSLLNQWDKLSQPVQLFDQYKGHEEPRSREVYTSVRDLCLWLANEKQEYEPSLEIERALLATFPELPLASAQLNEDIETLVGLLETKKFANFIEPLQQTIETAKANVPRLKREIAKGGFGPGARGMSRALFDAFRRAVNDLHSTKVSDVPWVLVRDLALTLNNDHEAPEAALSIIQTMLSNRDPPPSDEVRQKLSQDFHAADRNRKWNSLTKAESLPLQLSLVDQLLPGANEEEQTTLTAIKSALQQKRESQSRTRKFWVIVACIVGAFFIYAQSEDANESREVKKPVGQAETQSENIPAVANSQLLTRPEVRYCVFQAERLEMLRPMVSNYSDIEVQQFNALIDDQNARCGKFRYRPADLNAVNSQLASERQSLRRDAERMLRNIRGDQ